MSDFQKCPECNKALDMVCFCTPDNYYVQLPASDHVSKKALREWCEERINEWVPLVEHPAFSVKPEGVINEMNLILDHFCKEGES